MIGSLPWPTLAVIVLALVFAYLNGVIDSGSLVAATVSSRSLSPRQALGIGALAEFVGPFLLGTAVATTIGTGIVMADIVTPTLVLAGIGAAIVWNLIAVSLGVPTSSSHALIGGLVGAGIAQGSAQAIVPEGLILAVAALVLGPLLALLIGYLVYHATLIAVRGATPEVNRFFRRAQVVTLVLLALSHGTNDAQKSMGVIVLALVASGALASFTVPLWVVGLSALALSLGVLSGGQRVIRRLGSGLYRVRPVHGFSSQTASVAVILGATLAGAPVSTGQVVSGSLMGVGAAYRLSAVRWTVARDIVLAWLVTMPVSALVAASLLLLLNML